MDYKECQKYIYLLRDIAFTGAPCTELIEQANAKLTPLVQSFKNKETFIKGMEKIIKVPYYNPHKLEGAQKKKIKKANIHLKVKNLLENKSWEELCQTAFGDVVNLLEHVIDDSNKPTFRLRWKADVPSRYKGAHIVTETEQNGVYSVTMCAPDLNSPPYWTLGESFEDDWKIFSDLLEFAHKYSLPRLVAHCELELLYFLLNPEINALDYVIKTSGKKIFENIHKFGMFKILSQFPQHITSPDWLKLTETEIVFIRDNYHYFKLATEDKVWTAIHAWCSGTTNDANEARDKYNRIKSYGLLVDH